MALSREQKSDISARVAAYLIWTVVGVAGAYMGMKMVGEPSLEYALYAGLAASLIPLYFQVRDPLPLNRGDFRAGPDDFRRANIENGYIDENGKYLGH